MRRTVDNLERYTDEKEKIIDFLTKNDKELAVPISSFPWWIKETVHLLSEKGKIIIAEKWEEILWLLWITFGEPSKNYENQDIWYLYLLLLDTKSRRKRGIILWVFQKILEEMKSRWIQTIRFKADTNVIYNNNLYKKFAKIIDTQNNTQWVPCNLYEANVEELYQSMFIDNNFRPLLQK